MYNILKFNISTYSITLLKENLQIKVAYTYIESEKRTELRENFVKLLKLISICRPLQKEQLKIGFKGWSQDRSLKRKSVMKISYSSYYSNLRLDLNP